MNMFGKLKKLFTKQSPVEVKPISKPKRERKATSTPIEMSIERRLKILEDEVAKLKNK